MMDKATMMLALALAGCAMEHVGDVADTAARYRGTAVIRPLGHPTCGSDCTLEATWTVEDDAVVRWQGCTLVVGSAGTCNGMHWYTVVIMDGAVAAPFDGQGDWWERGLLLLPHP
jgi:hypothetical protein